LNLGAIGIVDGSTDQTLVEPESLIEKALVVHGDEEPAVGVVACDPFGSVAIGGKKSIERHRQKGVRQGGLGIDGGLLVEISPRLIMPAASISQFIKGYWSRESFVPPKASENARLVAVIDLPSQDEFTIL
jgi:hypothetical protein